MSGSDASRFIASNLNDLFREEELNLSIVRDHDALIRYIHDNTNAIFELSPKLQLQLITYAFAILKPKYHWEFLDFSLKPDPYVQLVHGLFSSQHQWEIYANAKMVQDLMLQSTSIRDQVLREVTWPAAYSILSSIEDASTDLFINTTPTQSHDDYQEQLDAGLISLRMMIESKNIDYARRMAMHNLFYLDTCFEHLLKSDTPKGNSLRETQSALRGICENTTAAQRIEQLQIIIKDATPTTKTQHLERLKLMQQLLALANTEISSMEFLTQKWSLLEAIRNIKTSRFHPSHKGAEIATHFDNLTLKELRTHSEVLQKELNIKLRTCYRATGPAGAGAGAEPEPTDESSDEPDDFIDMMGGLMKRAASDLSEGGTRWSTSNPLFSHHRLKDGDEEKAAGL